MIETVDSEGKAHVKDTKYSKHESTCLSIPGAQYATYGLEGHGCEDVRDPVHAETE